MGKSAFAHKGGVHVSAVLKDSATYEHIKPETVGNRQRVLVSDLSGRGNILYKLKQHGLADRLSEDARRELLERIKQMEYEGYELEAAEGTFELLVREALNPGMHFFDVESYEVSTRAGGAPAARAAPPRSRCARRTACIPPPPPGHGPFNALHLCLRKCLAKLYPQIADVRLTDYKVRVLDSNKGTAANVRVLIEWSRPSPELVHRGRLRQRDRGELESAGGRHPPGADAPDRAGSLDRPRGRGLLLGRVRVSEGGSRLRPER